MDDTFTIIKENPPVLNIARAGTNAVISWPSSLLNYQLERKTNITAAPWLPAAGPVAIFPGGQAVTVATTNSQQIFRLRSAP